MVVVMALDALVMLSEELEAVVVLLELLLESRAYAATPAITTTTRTTIAKTWVARAVRLSKSAGNFIGLHSRPRDIYFVTHTLDFVV